MEDQNKDFMPEGQIQEEISQAEVQVQEEIPQAEVQIQEEVPQAEVQIQEEIPQAEGQMPEEPQVEQTWMESSIYTTSDVYQTQTGQDVYQSSYINEESHEMGGLFSGEQAEGDINSSVYSDNQSVPDVYAGNQNNGYNFGMNGMDGNQYQYGNNGMNGNQYQYGNNGAAGNQYQYGNNGMNGNQYQYGNNGAAGNQYQYGNNGVSGNQYQYGNNGAAGNQYQYGNNGVSGNQYQYGNNGAAGNQYQYGNNGASGNQYQYGNPYAYNQNGYSPYATPQKKKQTGLIIGIIIAIVVIFLIAFLAIIYNAFKNLYYTSGRVEANNVVERIDDDTDRDNDDNHNFNNDRNNRDYGRDDDDDNDYDDDDYYEFHDDIKNNLSYSIKWDYFEYDTDNENVSIYVDYPVIVGDDVPNLNKLNAVISKEASLFSEYYEEEYSKYMDDNEDSYFNVTSTGYVTYMSESVLSVAFQERIDSNFFGAVYVYCINIDMNAGVVMDNTDIIEVDDEFSVDFRERNERQNGKNDMLDSMSDQEITKHLKSEDDLIIFYTPMGMEIGMNYGDGYGWVTVTYHDYKKFLKVF